VPAADIHARAPSTRQREVAAKTREPDREQRSVRRILSQFELRALRVEATGADDEVTDAVEIQIAEDDVRTVLAMAEPALLTLDLLDVAMPRFTS
jgi:hypothetical protein